MCDWITLPDEKIKLIPTEQDRQKFCMDIVTPSNILIGEKYVIEIVGTSNIDSQIQKHKIKMNCSTLIRCTAKLLLNFCPISHPTMLSVSKHSLKTDFMTVSYGTV